MQVPHVKKASLAILKSCMSVGHFCVWKIFLHGLVISLVLSSRVTEQNGLWMRNITFRENVPCYGKV